MEKNAGWPILLTGAPGAAGGEVAARLVDAFRARGWRIGNQTLGEDGSVSWLFAALGSTSTAVALA